MATQTSSPETTPRIIQWILDTRPLWPVPEQSRPREGVAALKLVASRALSFLTPTEQEGVLKYYHVIDAKMALASHLLKHLIITRYRHVPWSQSRISRDANGKPCFDPPAEKEEDHVEFNVSHQAGLVSLIAVVGRKGVNVGTDIVCVDERIKNDYSHIEKDGFFDWIDIYGDVFAESEISDMKIGELELNLPERMGTDLKGFGKDAISRCQWRNRILKIDIGKDEILELDSNLVIQAKLRRFYAMWCLREAYVKMTGEALLAPWLKELEISISRVPIEKDGIWKQYALVEGEVVKDFQIHFRGKIVTNVKMELAALAHNYIVGGAVRIDNGVDATGLEMGEWMKLDLEKDVLVFGEPIA